MAKQGYVCLIMVDPQQTSNVENHLKNLQKHPTSGVEVYGAWATFGAHDAVVIFSAETPERAMEFVTRNVSSIDGIRSTETLTGQPLPSFTPGASP